ncbi:MAG: hypothetical protein EX266_03995 [Rhodobacteraceae bacterium]|nr:hypothetical protein [Silicimonas sp.]RZW09959.1 MAG: hypothetical protein EX266_03995 [Paracoccaceae bacterium]
MWKAPIAAALAALLFSPAHAADWISEDGFVVHQTGPASFEVPWRGRSAVRDFWCAAGSYVRYELNLPGTTRVYRTSAVPRRSGQAMRFSLSPANAQPTGLAVIGSPKGLRAAHAVTFCDR